MKRLLSLILSASLVNPANSQIEQVINATFKKLGEITHNKAAAVPEAILEISIQLTPSNTPDTICALRFNDMTFQSPVFSSKEPPRSSIYFHNMNSTSDKLYNLLLNVFYDKKYEAKKYETIFILGTKTISIKRDFYADKPRVQFYTDEAMFTIKNRNELDGLFGK